uniref:omega-6 fatty acid desaturase, endoplasmic reticulum-like n=1 Tax=Erigeron canadensis TaxID=72917 RepID=UPI001CB95275|nr:omega-6 fatty acid desaturase, endoplasmic reticulum-like [Erigeron canadensis]
MGAGGQMNNDKTDAKLDVIKRAPVTKPPFEISDLKKAIPPHCYERNLTRSLYYLFRDIITCFALYQIALNYIPLLPKPLNYVAWPIYWFCQGSLFFGLWAIGHDLGHGSFSEYKWLNDALGFFLHSFLLNPYFSLKYSHRRHHAHTGSMEYDEVWVPKRKADTFFSEVLNNPLGNLILMWLRLVIGIPLYFTINTTGRKYDGFASHFYPQSPIFNDSERKLVWITDAGLLVVYYSLYKVAMTMSVSWLFFMYGAPWMIMNIHFTLISMMNHIHPELPHYDSREWDWLRGALSTVDRDFGIFNDIFHNTSCGHVMHHLFPTSIPHYHLVEATNAVKPILGDYYKYDDKPVLKAFWRESKDCIYVEPDEGSEKSGVYWFRK